VVTFGTGAGAESRSTPSLDRPRRRSAASPAAAPARTCWCAGPPRDRASGTARAPGRQGLRRSVGAGYRHRRSGRSSSSATRPRPLGGLVDAGAASPRPQDVNGTSTSITAASTR
jgi:hypothetical protein